MKPYAYLDGKILPLAEAKISVTDIGILRGYGVFDFARTHGGTLAMFKEHAARLRRSAKILDLKVPVTDAALKKIITALIAKNGFAESTVRMVLTGGSTIGNGLEYNRARPTFFIIVDRFVPLPASVYERGVKVVTLEHQRIFPEAKSNSYISAVRAQKLRRKLGAFEILYFDRGKFLEASTSNFSIVKNGKVVTAARNVLVGTTRNVVLQLARKKFRAEERDVTLKDVRAADEAFLTATNKGIVPVTRIDDRAVNSGKVGPVTKSLMKMYDERMSPIN